MEIHASGTYQVTLSLCAAAANCDVLENSIVSNMTGASCYYAFGATNRAITCNVTALATSGNALGGRIWFMGTTTPSGMITAATAFPSTFTDTTAGTITITLPSNTSFTAITGTLTTYSTYNAISYNYAPLVNINGNGPMAALPISGTSPDAKNYATYLWAQDDITGLTIASNGATAATAFINYAGPSTASAVGLVQGGIYGSTTAATKYNVALYTSGNMANNALRSTFTGAAAAVSPMTNYPGIDIFLNPNVFANAGGSSGNSIIASCWAGNAPARKQDATLSFNSLTTESVATTTPTVAATKLSTHCYSNAVSTSTTLAYLRLRLLVATTSTVAASAAGGIGTSASTTNAAGFDAVTSATPSSNKYMTFFWESAFQITAAYTGASLRADAYVGDFYGVMYALTPPASSPTYPVIKTGSPATTTSAPDVGELPTTSASYTYTLGTPFFWTQMIMGPYGNYVSGATAIPYYKSKSVFISGYTGTTAVSFTASNLVQMIRIRGNMNTTTGNADSGLYPTSSGSKIALFLCTPYAATANTPWEPLAGVNFTNRAGVLNTYNTQGTTAGPYVGNGAVRCWNAGSIGSCLHDRYGRPLPVSPYAVSLATNAYGLVNAIDLYQIITSDASITSNFSISILVKPKVLAAASYNTFVYRFGFATNGVYMVQSWDQILDNSAALATIAPIIYTPVATPFTGAVAALYPSTTSCTLPYSPTTTSGTAPAIRIVPGSLDIDNNISSLTPLQAQVGTSGASGVVPSSRQGYIIWCAQWNFKQSGSFAISSTTLEVANTLNDKCYAFDYLTPDTVNAASVATSLYCAYCPISATGVVAQSTTSSPAVANMTSFFTGPATNIPTPTFSNLADDSGRVQEYSTCTTTVGTTGLTPPTVWNPQTITANPVTSSYNISGQKITITFTAPSGIAAGVVDNIVLVGKNGTSGLADSQFPYGTLDGATVCRLYPGSNPTSLDQANFVSCNANAGSGSLIISGFSILSNQTYITTWTIYIWGFNGAGWTSTLTTSPASTQFLMQTYLGSNTFVVDQSSTTAANFINWTLTNTSTNLFSISTTTLGYQRPLIGARGWFRFDISFSQRTWFYSDKVVLNLDSIISSTVNVNTSVVKCRITDTSDNIWQSFQSCTLSPASTPPTVTIIGLNPYYAVYPIDFSASTGIRVYLDNMVTLTPQSNKTIYGYVQFMGTAANGTTQVLTRANTTSDFTAANVSTTQAFSSAGANITKWWSQANDNQDLTFSLSTSTAFNSSCRVTIVFPSYYNPGLTTRSVTPYCTVNGVYSQCVVGQLTIATSNAISNSLANGQRQLVIYGASTSSTAGSSIVIRVNGISAPPASYVAESFWIQINGDNSESTSTIIYAGAVLDASYSTTNTLIYALNVNWFTISSSTSRSTATFTWTFALNVTAGIVNTTQAVQVIFPDNYGLAWGEFTPTCMVMDNINSTIVYASAQSIFGDLVQLNVSTQIPAGNVVVLSCQNIRTPLTDTTYRSQDVTIRVADMNGGAVYQRSAPGVHNVNSSYAFAKGSSQTYITWSQTSSSFAPLALTSGTYNLALTATVPSKSSRSFTISPSDSRFAFLSSAAPFWLVTGYTQNGTFLGCASSVPVGLYVITFTVSDNSSTYVAPSTIWVSVNNVIQTVPVPTSNLVAFYSSSSLSSTAPLCFDLTSNPPYSDITLTPNITLSANTNFTFSPSSIKLTPAAPKACFVFTSTSAATVAASAVYNFIVLGTNAAVYTVASSVTVSLTTDSGTGTVNTPVVVVAADSTDASAATSKVITFTLSQVTQATIYWVVTLQGQSITDATAIQMNSVALTMYSMNSANQAQYFTNYVVTSTKTAVTVSNLFPNTGYTVSAVAVSNTNKSSTVATFTFVTGANAAVISRWLFNYTTYPSQAQRQSLLCLLTQNLAVPAINIRNVNGEICGNTTAFYATSNSTGDLGVYFYPLQATTDTTMTASALQTALNGTTSNVLSTMNTSLSSGTTGIGWMTAFVDIATIKNMVPTITIPSSIPSSQLTTGSIYFTATASNDTGFLFVTLCSNSSTTPTAIQIKQASANITTISGALSTQVFYFYPGASLTYNFTGLNAATSYNMYVVASNNDPSFLQNFTSVTAMSVTTPSVNSGSSAGQIGVIFSVMTVLASVISLMFF
jgi:hypothetical protein